jgi:acetyl-CoA carboxylase biotin carboxyl carrier protein
MAKFDVDSDLVKKLAALLKETDLSEIEFAEGEKRIRLNRQTVFAGPMMAPASAVSATPATAAGAPSAAAISGTPINAPMVGTVYLSPEPSKPAFVKVGDSVKAGDTLMIIEAMKVMNPIKAPSGGTIKAIHVTDAKPVEFGELLLVIE